MSMHTSNETALRDVLHEISTSLGVTQAHYEETLAQLLPSASDPHSLEKARLWAAFAKFLAPRLTAASSPYWTAPTSTAQELFADTDSNMDGLIQGIDSLMCSFFAQDPERRDLLSRIRHDLILRHEDNNTIYLAYVYFIQEEVFARSCLSALPRSSQKHLFEAVWNLHLSSKCQLLRSHSFDGLECVYLMLSVMYTIDVWARILQICISKPCTSTSSPPTPSTHDLEIPTSIADVCRAKLSDWKVFHRDTFVPFAKRHIIPLLPMSASFSSDDHDLLHLMTPAQPISHISTNVGDMKTGIKKMLVESRTLVANSDVEQLEFDELTLLHSYPLHSFYPITALPASTTNGTQTRNSRPSHPEQLGASTCRSAMFQLHAQLSAISWIHSYISTTAKRHDPSENLPLNTDSPGRTTSTSSISITLEEVIPEMRLSEIKAKVHEWNSAIKAETNIPAPHLELCNKFFFRFLLDVLVEDGEVSTQGGKFVPSPLASSETFISSLYAAIFEVCMACYRRSSAASCAFPYIVHVVGANYMAFCKLISSVARLLSPTPQPSRLLEARVHSAPKLMAAHLNQLEETIISEHLWRPGSNIFRAYTDGTENFFKYIVTSAGPPRQPRMAIQTALTKHDAVERFTQMYHDPNSTLGTLNRDAHTIFCKLLRIGCTRIRFLCKTIPAFSDNYPAICQAELLFTIIATQKLHFLMERHIDTFVLCSILAISEIILGRSDIFETLLKSYSQIPQSSDTAVHLIPVTVLPPGPAPPSQEPSPAASEEPERRYITILEFFQGVFVRELENLLSKFLKRESGVISQTTPSNLDRDSNLSARERIMKDPKSPVLLRSNGPLADATKRVEHQSNGSSTSSQSAPMKDPFAGVARRLDFSDAIEPAQGVNVVPAVPNPPRTRAASTRAKAPSTTTKPTSVLPTPLYLPMVPTPPRVRPQRKPGNSTNVSTSAPATTAANNPNNHTTNAADNNNAANRAHTESPPTEAPRAPSKRRKRSPPPSPTQAPGAGAPLKRARHS